MANPVVGIIMGSESDREVMSEAAKLLDRFGISHETVVSSAHRNPEKTRAYAQSAKGRGLKVIIAGAGMAAHLAGVVASGTELPVIGVPLAGSALSGVDALYSMVQMPAGVPVGTMAIGMAGAKNAALFAAQILALTDQEIARKLKQFREEMAE
jgi:phosphoribosylaminoimidazole carboxylase PurE protein